MDTQKMAVVLACLLLVSLSVNLQKCQAVSAPEETTELYQSFLTEVMGVNLTEYNITSSGYGTSYPSNLGGNVKEETISYTLDSGQGKLSTWCLIRDGVITSCNLNPIEGKTFFAYDVNLKDSMSSCLQRYLIFASKNYQKDTAHILQALSSIDEIEYQTESEEIVGDMRLTVKPTYYETTIKWAYNQEGVEITRKCILIEFMNGSVSRFVDTWNLYSVYNETVLSEEAAQSIAFEAAQAKPVNMVSFEGSTPAPVQVTPDWNGWTYTVDLNLVPGAQTVEGMGLSDDTLSIHGDPLMLYPVWHFVFYFGKPIGNMLGVEVGVWADTGEVAYSNVYGVLGPSITDTPENTSAPQTMAPETTASLSPQLSDETKNDTLPINSGYIIATILGVIFAVSVASLIIVRKRKNVEQQIG